MSDSSSSIKLASEVYDLNTVSLALAGDIKQKIIQFIMTHHNIAWLDDTLEEKMYELLFDWVDNELQVLVQTILNRS